MDQNGAKRYSAALFEAAKENGRVEVYLEQMEKLSIIFAQNPEFMKILRHPNIQVTEKKDMVDKALKGRIDDEIIRLVYVLLDHDKIDELIKVNLHYRELVYEYKGIKIAYVTTAVKLDNEEIEALRMRLSNKYGCTIEIENIVDPSVVGGVYLKIGDEITDGTVRGNFQKMKKLLMNHNMR